MSNSPLRPGHQKIFGGHIITGEGRGKEIGFPTINIHLARRGGLQSAQYEEGIFSVRGEIQEKEFEGIAHFGPRPTFEDERLSVEIHIFNFDETVGTSHVSPDTEVKFETLGERIREVRKFESMEELKEQIEKDCEKAKKILQNG